MADQSGPPGAPSRTMTVMQTVWFYQPSVGWVRSTKEVEVDTAAPPALHRAASDPTSESHKPSVMGHDIFSQKMRQFASQVTVMAREEELEKRRASMIPVSSVPATTDPTPGAPLVGTLRKTTRTRSVSPSKREAPRSDARSGTDTVERRDSASSKQSFTDVAMFLNGSGTTRRLHTPLTTNTVSLHSGSLEAVTKLSVLPKHRARSNSLDKGYQLIAEVMMDQLEAEDLLGIKPASGVPSPTASTHTAQEETKSKFLVNDPVSQKMRQFATQVLYMESDERPAWGRSVLASPRRSVTGTNFTGFPARRPGSRRSMADVSEASSRVRHSSVPRAPQADGLPTTNPPPANRRASLLDRLMNRPSSSLDLRPEQSLAAAVDVLVGPTKPIPHRTRSVFGPRDFHG